MQYRFAAFDLDGTLLNDKKELTPKPAQHLRSCKRAVYG